jgi:hypothetical protein
MAFPILTIIGFLSLIAGFYYKNTIIFIAGLAITFIAMALMARGSPQ